MTSKYKVYIHKIYIPWKIFCAIIPVWKSCSHHCPPPFHSPSLEPLPPSSSSFSLTNLYLFYVLVISSQVSPTTHVNPPTYTAPSTSCLSCMFYDNKISPISSTHTHMSVGFILCGTCNRPMNKPPPEIKWLFLLRQTSNAIFSCTGVGTLRIRNHFLLHAVFCNLFDRVKSCSSSHRYSEFMCATDIWCKMT